MATIPISGPGVPFLGLIPGGLQIGQMVKVIGRMNHNGDRFVIDIQCGAALKPSDNKALHISVRPKENAIVRNHFVNHGWGNEERHGICSIQQGQPFEIVILAEVTFYKIAINGKHFCTFNHRLPLHGNANFIHINGDCTISFIGQESDISPPSAPYLPPTAQIPTPYAPGFNPPAPPPPYTLPYTPPYTPPGSNVVIHHHHTHSSPGHQGPHGYNSHAPPSKKSNKALKYAAGIGGGIGAAGLGIYALSKLSRGSGSCSDSD